jgi:hypothetical protein
MTRESIRLAIVFDFLDHVFGEFAVFLVFGFGTAVDLTVWKGMEREMVSRRRRIIESLVLKAHWLTTTIPKF